jgi:hypothetical protein
LAVLAASVFLQPVIAGLNMLVQGEGRWGPFRPLQVYLSSRNRRRRERLIATLYKLADSDGLPDAERDATMRETADRLRRYPRYEPIRATLLGNIVAAAEADSEEAYGLDARLVLPRLELLIPQATVNMLQERRDDLTFALRFAPPSC